MFELHGQMKITSKLILKKKKREIMYRKNEEQSCLVNERNDIWILKMSWLLNGTQQPIIKKTLEIHILCERKLWKKEVEDSNITTIRKNQYFIYRKWQIKKIKTI
jgi:hypothetical protein